MRPSDILLGGKATDRSLRRAFASTFVEVADPARRYTSFAWLLALSAVIATGGIAAGSTAVVIGAMLIAPLMSPMLGTTLAIVTARPKDALRTFAMTCAGIVACVGLSAMVAAIIPVGIDTSTNSEVLSRTSPRLVDLLIAVAAGLTAALAAIREDIPDAAPGVAIAASIVPPLCVIGISLCEGDPGSAMGAWLLFATNYFAIQATGLAVFVLAGVGKKEGEESARKARVIWYVVAAVGTLVVSVPLLLSSMDMAARASEERAMRAAVQEWLSETPDYRLTSIDASPEALCLEVAGHGDRPSPEKLRETLVISGVDPAEIRVAYVEEDRV